MDTTRLRQIQADQTNKLVSQHQHQALLTSANQTRNTIIETTESLIKYLEGHTTKTELVNQLESVGTPDVIKVVEAVNELHETLRTHKNTDLSEITEVMQSILNEAKLIPKSLPEAAEQKFIDYSDQFKSLKDAVKAVGEFVREQKLVAEAPIVNVPETKVEVAAPDLKPLQTSIKDVVTAVKDIVIPEYTTDNKKVEELIAKTNKVLQKILEKPVGGGGGGGSSWSAVGSDDLPHPLLVDTYSSLMTIDANRKETLAYSEVLTATDTLTPTSGMKLKIVKILILANPDNTAANLVSLSFPSLGTFLRGWTLASSTEWIGETDEALTITLGASEEVSVNIQYKEIT
jgi:hypothetical protein